MHILYLGDYIYINSQSIALSWNWADEDIAVSSDRQSERCDVPISIYI